MPEIMDLEDMLFDDPELEPTILPVDARLSLRGSVSEFRTIFERMTAIAPQKEKIPGTSMVYVEADDGVVKFMASDGAQTLIIETTSLRINREGKAMLPGHKLKAIFSLAPDPGATLTILASTATVSSGRAVWNIAVAEGAKMPAVADISAVEMHPVPRRGLYKALSAVKRALPSLGGRKSLEQVNIAAGAVTASDGYRLLRQKVEGFPKSLQFSVPKDTVDELMRSLSAGTEDHILLGASKTLIVVKDGLETLVSRQLLMDFPDLESQLLAPALENNHIISVNAVELKNLVKRVRVSADPEYAAVTLHFGKLKDGDWELTVFTRDRTGNSASESTSAMWEGEVAPFDITLNHKYLIDLLDAYPGSVATLRAGTNTKTRAAPLLLKDDERGFTAVVQQSLGR